MMSKIRVSVSRFLPRHVTLPLILTIPLLIIGAGVMIITSRPVACFAVILGIPFLILLCNYPKALVYTLIVYSFFVKFLISDVGLGTITNYICDGLLLIALFFALTASKSSPSFFAMRVLCWEVFAFYIIATLSAITHGVSFGLYLWACRNTFRLFGILYCCVKLLNKSDVYRLIKFVFVFFILNAVVCTYQHFLLGVSPDDTNGLFGTASGGNAMINVLIFTVCALSLFGLLDNKFPWWILLLTISCSCYLAAIAELKVFYFELIALIIFAIFSNKFSFKLMMPLIIIAVIITVGIHVLIVFNPRFADFFNWEQIINYSGNGGYSNPYNLNRITAIQTLDDRFMHTQGDRLFGLGFGAGQFSQFFASPLYATYGFILNWNWFTDAAIFLETGYMGLFLYSVPFISITFFALRYIRLSDFSHEHISIERGAASYVWIDKACASIALLCLLLIFYNSTLTTDPGCYFIGFILSFPFIIQKSIRQKEVSNV